MNGVSRSLCTFEDIRSQEYGTSSHSGVCVTFLAGNEPNMTYGGINVEERLEYARSHLVHEPHRAGKKAQRDHY